MCENSDKIATSASKSWLQNKRVWNNIYGRGEKLEYPSEELVRLTSYLFKDRDGKKLLDYGFGSGNNLIHFAKQGFNCY